MGQRRKARECALQILYQMDTTGSSGEASVVSTNSFGGKRTDFHERAAGTQPLPYLIHMCTRCAYSGSERDFGDEAEVSPML